MPRTLLMTVLLSTTVHASAPSSPLPYLDRTLSVDQRVEDLLGRMTLEEKLGQMTQVNLTRLMGRDEWDRGPLNPEWLATTLKDLQVGSLLSGGGAAPLPNTFENWANTTNELQKYTLAHSRLKIPLIYGVDAVHGHNNVAGATIFPHNLGLAATGNPTLVEQVNRSTAKAVRATGIHWNFSPDADLGRDPRWGRFYETFGEDPHLSAVMVAAATRGLQQDLTGTGVAATVKHFVGYGQPLSGFDRTPAQLPLRLLREQHLPSFQAGIQAGALAIMANSGSVNGVPVHASAYLLRDVLRGQLGFDGVVVSDWEDIKRLQTVHRTARDFEDAVQQSVNAGVDMYMVPHDAKSFIDALATLVKGGRVPEARVNDAVRRVLTLKFKLGLFEQPFVDASKAGAHASADRALARRAAAESMTLLRHEGNVLPIGANAKTVLVTGPGATSVRNQMGGWTIGWQGIPQGSRELPPAVNVVDGLKATAPRGVQVRHVPEGDATLKAAAKQAGVVVAVVGEGPYAEGEGNSATIALADAQVKLLRDLIGSGRPVVAVVMAGRPLILPQDVVAGLSGLIMAYLPGSEAGHAIGDVLFGRSNPAGRLPFSWPKSAGQLPLAYNHAYGDVYDPLFAFGHGLSYAKFTYRNLNVPESVMRDGQASVSVQVTNTGKVAGEDIVQVFAKRAYSPVLAPARQLVGFARVQLSPGETKTVQVPLTAAQLAVVPGDVTGTEGPQVIPGTYEVEVGKLRAPLDVR